MIRSNWVISDPTNTYQVPPPAVPVFRQRFIIDSFVLSQASSHSYLPYQSNCDVPAGSRVMAALATTRALLLRDRTQDVELLPSLLAGREFRLHDPPGPTGGIHLPRLESTCTCCGSLPPRTA